MLFLEILKAVFWIFSVFGFFCAIRYGAGYFLIKQGSFKKSEMLLKVENDEDTIEDTIRILAEEIFFTSKEKLFSSLTVVDMGSSDNTIKIASMLKREYPFLVIKDKNDFNL